MRASWVEWGRVVLAAAIAVVVLAGLAVLTGAPPLPPSAEEAAGNPFWAQMVIMGIMTAVWFLAGPAFARARPDLQGARR